MYGTGCEYCMVLDVGIVLCWKKDCESMKRKCSGFVAGCIPSSFWTAIKGLTNFFVDISHRLCEPRYIYVSLYCLLCFYILFIDLNVNLLLLCGPVFLTIGIRAKRSIWFVNSQETRVPGSSGSNGRRRQV